MGDTPEIIDEVYVKFYNNSCHGGNERVFNQATREWLSFSHNFKGPAVYVGLPASQDATTGQGYRNITQARKIFEVPLALLFLLLQHLINKYTKDIINLIISLNIPIKANCISFFQV